MYVFSMYSNSDACKFATQRALMNESVLSVSETPIVPGILAAETLLGKLPANNSVYNYQKRYIEG